MSARLLLIAMIVLIGCQPQPKPRSATTAPTTQESDADAEAEKKPTNPFLPVIQANKVAIWQINVPYLSVSTNEAFWKYVDETALDAATHDMLYKNGLRVGLCAADDWDALRRILASNHATSQLHQYSGPDAQAVELPMRAAIPSQAIFYFDLAGHLAGRTFESCDNLFAISFEPTPDRPRQSTRIVIHPMVRSQRTEIAFTKVNNAMQVQYVHPQHLYELSLKTDVSRDHFLVIAPSPEARGATSIGHAFLTRDDQPEQTESILIILPTGYEQPKPAK